MTQSLPTVLRNLEAKGSVKQTSSTTMASAEECDQKIQDLEKQVDSGKLSLLQERKAIAEISALKRTRRTLTDPSPSASPKNSSLPQKKDLSVEEMNVAIHDAQRDLDRLAKSREEESARLAEEREKRSKAQKDLDEAYEAKRALIRDYRQATEAFLQFQAEDRKRREALAKERKAEEARERREEAARREREEAEAPAFEVELEACATLRNLLGSLIGTSPSSLSPTDSTKSSSSTTTTAFLGTPNARPVDEGNVPMGKVLQRKDEREESYFMGKGPSSVRKAQKSSSSSPSSRPSAPFKLPLSTMEQLWDLKIEVPVSLADVPKTLEAIDTKRQWYLDNQERVTNERKAKAERRIQEIMGQGPLKAQDMTTPIA